MLLNLFLPEQAEWFFLKHFMLQQSYIQNFPIVFLPSKEKNRKWNPLQSSTRPCKRWPSSPTTLHISHFTPETDHFAISPTQWPSSPAGHVPSMSAVIWMSARATPLPLVGLCANVTFSLCDGFSVCLLHSLSPISFHNPYLHFHFFFLKHFTINYAFYYLLLPISPHEHRSSMRVGLFYLLLFYLLLYS